MNRINAKSTKRALVKSAALGYNRGKGMKRFSLDGNIETISWRRPLFNMVLHSVAAFCAGVTVCFASVSVVRYFQTQDGVGGLDTAGVPEFTTDMLDNFNTISSKEKPASLDAVQEALLIADDAAAGDSQKSIAEAESTLMPAPDAMAGLSYMTYRVKSGDMIGRIAEAHGITQDTIISVNDVRRSRNMRVGTYLKIPSISGILYTVKDNGENALSIATKYNVDADKCARVNSIDKEASLAVGASLFVPDAHLDKETLGTINGDFFNRPLHSRYWLTSYYGWRSSPFETGRRSFHTGIDMAATYGTSIFPARDGVVASTGYNNTYGNFVIIRHGSGYKTLYGHMQTILCVAGQGVDTSVCIGKVGSTGMSTGPHLHFTVFKNEKTINPLGLMK